LTTQDPPPRLSEVYYSHRKSSLAFTFALREIVRIQGPVFRYSFYVAGCHLALFHEIDLLDSRVLCAEMPSTLLYTFFFFLFCTVFVSAGADYYKILDCTPPNPCVGHKCSILTSRHLFYIQYIVQHQMRTSKRHINDSAESSTQTRTRTQMQRRNLWRLPAVCCSNCY